MVSVDHDESKIVDQCIPCVQEVPTPVPSAHYSKQVINTIMSPRTTNNFEQLQLSLLLNTVSHKGNDTELIGSNENSKCCNAIDHEEDKIV